MINALLSKLGLGDGSLNADVETRRKFIRHIGAKAEVVVGERSYSLKDWSMGGISFETLPDSRMIAGDKLNLTLRFRFPTEVISVQHEGRIVRAGTRGVAAEFLPVSNDVRRQLERVVDNINAEEFLRSQIA